MAKPNIDKSLSAGTAAAVEQVTKSDLIEAALNNYLNKYGPQGK